MEMFTLAANWGTLYIQPEKLSKGELNSINEESTCDEKDKNAPEKTTLVKKKYL